MNLDKKLELAHEYAKVILKNKLNDIFEFGDIAYDAFAIVDAMEAEYNKRKPSGLPDAIADNKRKPIPPKVDVPKINY